MESTTYEYTVSSHPHQNPFITAELTCAEVLRQRIHLPGNQLIPLPDETTTLYTGFTPLNRSNSSTNTPINNVVKITPRLNGITLFTKSTNNCCNSNDYLQNCEKIYRIMRRFGITDYGCSTILREIDDANDVLMERGRRSGGVIEVKIWKIINVDRRPKQMMLIDWTWSGSDVGSDIGSDIGSEGCVICMEDYEEGSVVSRLVCGHEFHGLCIKPWLNINYRCPLCRFSLL